MHEVGSKALSHAFGREEEGTVLGDIEGCLTRNLCECILYLYGEICGIPENVPRFLKMPLIFLKSSIYGWNLWLLRAQCRLISFHLKGSR